MNNSDSALSTSELSVDNLSAYGHLLYNTGRDLLRAGFSELGEIHALSPVELARHGLTTRDLVTASLAYIPALEKVGHLTGFVAFSPLVACDGSIVFELACKIQP